MKIFVKNMVIIGLGVLIMGGVHSPPVASAASAKVQAARLPAIKIYLNNTQITSSTGGATLLNGTVMLPLDGLYVSGGSVKYDERTKIISIGNMFTRGSMKVGSKSATVNGNKKTYSVAPQQLNRHLYLPLRFVSDAIGGSLKWNAESREAFISYSEFVGDGQNQKDAYFLNGVDGTLYKRDAAGVIHSMGVSSAKLDPYSIAGTQVSFVKITEDADLVTIHNSSGEPSVNLTIFNLFVKQGIIIRHSKANYWQYSPQELKVYNGNAVMNDGHTVRLIAPDGSVKQVWNLSKIAGTPQVSYSIEAVGENYVIARSSNEGMLTLFDTKANQAILLYKEFGICPTDMPGFKYDGITFTGESEDTSELRFEFKNDKKENRSFTYQLGSQ